MPSCLHCCALCPVEPCACPPTAPLHELWHSACLCACSRPLGLLSLWQSACLCACSRPLGLLSLGSPLTRARPSVVACYAVRAAWALCVPPVGSVPLLWAVCAGQAAYVPPVGGVPLWQCAPIGQRAVHWCISPAQLWVCAPAACSTCRCRTLGGIQACTGCPPAPAPSGPHPCACAHAGSQPFKGPQRRGRGVLPLHTLQLSPFRGVRARAHVGYTCVLLWLARAQLPVQRVPSRTDGCVVCALKPQPTVRKFVPFSLCVQAGSARSCCAELVPGSALLLMLGAGQ